MRAPGLILARLACVLAAGLWLLPPAALAQPKLPELRGHVNDEAKLLPPERAVQLEARLREYERRTGHQFVLLTVPSLEGDTIEGFGIRVAERWKLGQKGKDDGLVLIVVPSERTMRVEVGYGLEGTVPDAIASRVVRELLTPAFRQGDYAGGIDAAFTALMRAASGEEVPPSAAPAAKPPASAEPAARLSPLVLPLLLFFLFSFLSRGRGRNLRHRPGGFWIGPPMGGGGFGRGGGGRGFGGGGGRFGGGGASGRW